jgi:hypothetical protein
MYGVIICEAEDLTPHPHRTHIPRPHIPSVLKIFDVTGKLVKEFDQKSPIVWYGRDNQSKQLPSGIYIVQLMASNVTATKKVILLE